MRGIHGGVYCAPVAAPGANGCGFWEKLAGISPWILLSGAGCASPCLFCIPTSSFFCCTLCLFQANTAANSTTRRMITRVAELETPSSVLSGSGVVNDESRASITVDSATMIDEDKDAMALLMSTIDGGGGMVARDSAVTDSECMNILIAESSTDESLLLLIVVELLLQTGHEPITHATPLTKSTVVLNCDALPLAIVIALEKAVVMDRRLEHTSPTVLFNVMFASARRNEAYAAVVVIAAVLMVVATAVVAFVVLSDAMVEEEEDVFVVVFVVVGDGDVDGGGVLEVE